MEYEGEAYTAFMKPSKETVSIAVYESCQHNRLQMLHHLTALTMLVRRYPAPASYTRIKISETDLHKRYFVIPDRYKCFTPSILVLPLLERVVELIDENGGDGGAADVSPRNKYVSQAARERQLKTKVKPYDEGFKIDAGDFITGLGAFIQADSPDTGLKHTAPQHQSQLSVVDQPRTLPQQQMQPRPVGQASTPVRQQTPVASSQTLAAAGATSVARALIEPTTGSRPATASDSPCRPAGVNISNSPTAFPDSAAVPALDVATSETRVGDPTQTSNKSSPIGGNKDPAYPTTLPEPKKVPKTPTPNSDGNAFTTKKEQRYVPWMSNKQLMGLGVVGLIGAGIYFK